MIQRIYFVFAVLVSLCLSIVSPAFAHGRTPRLEISAERLNPGGVLDIRGVGFDYEELVTLYLERQGIVISLGQITADLEGIFVHTILLPSDLPIGEYSIRGVTEHHDVISPTFTVQGSAVPAEEVGREEREALLAPMPTYAPGIVPGGVPQPPPDQTPQVMALETPSSRGRSTTLLYSILLGIGIIALVAIRIIRNK